MTFGSLFAGIGGMDLGLERAGMKCVWQVEIDGYATRVLAKHWPNVRRHGDVRTFPPSCGTQDWGCALIAGGPPCQRTSATAAVSGKRTGETLWPEMFRVVQAVRPSWVIVEQPPAGQAWEAKVKGDLEGTGYRCSRLPVEAGDFGAPHRRRRVFFVADALRQRCETRLWLPIPPKAPATPWPAPPRGTWRPTGTRCGGVDDGFSNWVDRLRCLGNAVVPQVAEWIGRKILEGEQHA